MSRLIDADLLKSTEQTGKVFACECDALYGILQLIDDQPTVNEWILCSDGLPESDNSRSYLVTKICVDEENVISEVCTEIFWINDNKWDCERDCYCEWEVIAWQPLPQPYTENREES